MQPVADRMDFAPASGVRNQMLASFASDVLISIFPERELDGARLIERDLDSDEIGLNAT